MLENLKTTMCEHANVCMHIHTCSNIVKHARTRVMQVFHTSRSEPAFSVSIFLCHFNYLLTFKYDVTKSCFDIIVFQGRCFLIWVYTFS